MFCALQSIMLSQFYNFVEKVKLLTWDRMYQSFIPARVPIYNHGNKLLDKRKNLRESSIS